MAWGGGPGFWGFGGGGVGQPRFPGADKAINRGGEYNNGGGGVGVGMEDE